MENLHNKIAFFQPSFSLPYTSPVMSLLAQIFKSFWHVLAQDSWVGNMFSKCELLSHILTWLGKLFSQYIPGGNCKLNEWFCYLNLINFSISYFQQRREEVNGRSGHKTKIIIQSKAKQNREMIRNKNDLDIKSSSDPQLRWVRRARLEEKSACCYSSSRHFFQ